MEVCASPRVRYSYATINNVPTRVVQVGKTDLCPERQEPLLIMIPGNPGIIEYYEDFLSEIYNHFQGSIHVCGVSHAGHDEVWKSGIAPPPNENWQLYGLEGQVRHKLEFVRSYVSSRRPLFLAGHSIGAYMVLRILGELGGLNVRRSFLLFPVFERMREAPNARSLVWNRRLFKVVTRMVSLLLLVLPDVLRCTLVGWYCRSLPEGVRNRAFAATCTLFTPTVFRLMIDMAEEELQQLKERDDALIRAHLDRLTFYYGCKDGWCPTRFYWEMREAYPKADLTLCKDNLKHAFVLDRTEGIATFVSDKIRNSL
ncbi:lipid droplet-associated hydrolase-like [Haemaphysalis longicornis]